MNPIGRASATFFYFLQYRKFQDLLQKITIVCYGENLSQKIIIAVERGDRNCSSPHIDRNYRDLFSQAVGCVAHTKNCT